MYAIFIISTYLKYAQHLSKDHSQTKFIKKGVENKKLTQRIMVQHSCPAGLYQYYRPSGRMLERERDPGGVDPG